jgi:hypothetical protein
MAKKQSFADKAKGKDKSDLERVKVVKAVKTASGHWKFKTTMVAITDENRKEVYGG